MLESLTKSTEPVREVMAWVDKCCERLIGSSRAGHGGAEERSTMNSRAVLIRLGYVTSQVMRDLIMKLFLDDWIALKVLRTVALSSNSVATSVELEQSSEKSEGAQEFIPTQIRVLTEENFTFELEESRTFVRRWRELGASECSESCTFHWRWGFRLSFHVWSDAKEVTQERFQAGLHPEKSEKIAEDKTDRIGIAGESAKRTFFFRRKNSRYRQRDNVRGFVTVSHAIRNNTFVEFRICGVGRVRSRAAARVHRLNLSPLPRRVSLLTVVDIVGLNWAVPALRSNADGSAGLGSTPESQDDEFPAVNSMARLRRPMGTLDKSEVAAAWKWVNYMSFEWCKQQERKSSGVAEKFGSNAVQPWPSSVKDERIKEPAEGEDGERAAACGSLSRYRLRTELLTEVLKQTCPRKKGRRRVGARPHPVRKLKIGDERSGKDKYQAARFAAQITVLPVFYRQVQSPSAKMPSTAARSRCSRNENKKMRSVLVGMDEDKPSGKRLKWRRTRNAARYHCPMRTGMRANANAFASAPSATEKTKAETSRGAHPPRSTALIVLHPRTLSRSRRKPYAAHPRARIREGAVLPMPMHSEVEVEVVLVGGTQGVVPAAQSCRYERQPGREIVKGWGMEEEEEGEQRADESQYAYSHSHSRPARMGHGCSPPHTALADVLSRGGGGVSSCIAHAPLALDGWYDRNHQRHRGLDIIAWPHHPYPLRAYHDPQSSTCRPAAPTVAHLSIPAGAHEWHRRRTRTHDVRLHHL
ncbi:hypothetical protein B0H13DRAFT_2507069 [Mycena leptocephala]|nr:hypothetical protein B0H13DRAFT_2507069 [Mycena leptocephala]